MTRIVVLDEELHEAITVVEIPASFMRAVEAGHHPPLLRLAVYDNLPVTVSMEQMVNETMMTYRHVFLRLERVMRGRETRPIFWYAYADDPQLALLLRAAFLPGQIGEVQRREREAFWRGAFAAAGEG